MGGKVIAISHDLSSLRVRLPLGWRTRNVLGSLYGGSLFGVTDGPHPLLLMMQLGTEVIIWDKQASITFRRPAYRTLYATFEITGAETQSIQQSLAQASETSRSYCIELVDAHGEVYAVVERTLYIATKAHYLKKQREREKRDESNLA